MAFLPTHLFRKQVTIDATKVDSTLSNFPVRISLVGASGGNFDFSKARSDGFDIRFTADDGETLLKYERESHDAIGETAEYWVKIPSISSTVDTNFFIYYGDSDSNNPLMDTDLTDPADIATKAFSDSEFNASHKDDFAFDDNIDGTSNRWAADGSAFPHWIGWDFGSGNSQIITAYSILARNDGSWNEVPYDWELQASNTGAWTGEEVVLDIKVNEVFTQNQKRIFATFSEGTNTTAYRYYRIHATDNQPSSGNTNIAVTEIEFFSGTINPGDTWDNNYKFVSHMDDKTTSTIKDSSSNGKDGIKTSTNAPNEIIGNIANAQEFDGTDEISLPNLGFSGDVSITISARIRVDGSTNQRSGIFGFGNFGSNNQSCAFRTGDNGAVPYDDALLFYFFGNDLEVTGLSSYYGNWVQVDAVYDSSTSSRKIYLDGTQVGNDSPANPNFQNQTYIIGGYNEQMEGIIDEIRISDIARSAAWIKVNSNSIEDTLLSFGNEEAFSESLTISETINVSDSLNVSTDPEQLNINETINISDFLQAQENPESLTISETINVSDVLNATFGTNAEFITAILHLNPLLCVTDTDPAKIVEVDITDPENPSHTVYILTGAKNAKDIAINTITNFVYIACADGIIVKADLDDLSNQTLIDVNDTDDILTIETLSDFGLVYGSTENAIGELYLIDNRTIQIIDSNIKLIQPKFSTLDSEITLIELQKLDSDINILSEQSTLLNTDFKLVSAPLNNITPIKLTDFQVFINSIELEDTDLILDSITITHTIGEESSAQFTLSRKHDQLNTTLEGISSQITNQNSVRIDINGQTEFTGNISSLNCLYDTEELVQVFALGAEKISSFNQILLSLPSLITRLNLYDILIQNPIISNPIINPNDENPSKFKGIQIDLGQKIEQSIFRRTEFDSENVNTGFNTFEQRGRIAKDIEDGNFIPVQNHTYFWSPTVQKIASKSRVEKIEGGEEQGTNFINDIGESTFVAKNDIEKFRQEFRSPLGGIDFIESGDVAKIHFSYIGTSLSPVSEDLWRLTRAKHRRQKIAEDIVTELGIFTIGSAPFKEISITNGRLISKFKWVDEKNGLYSIKDAAYNFIDYAKRVANLEYQKILNINGDIFPETSTTIELTVDAYQYYGMTLLTRINIDNTTEPNIYKNNNGFPVSIKTINITSANRKVTLIADNLKSIKELEEIDGQFPDENDQEYNEEERRILVSLKTNMKTSLQVE